MRIPRALLDEMIAHAREDAPNECCGIAGARDGQAVTLHRARNVHNSPLRYEIDPRDMFEILERLDDDGLEVGVIYHSHTRSDPVPSQTDINMANPLFPDAVYVIVGVAGEEPDVRGFHIRDGRVSEALLEVV